jgi:hypothetical protein
MKKFLVSVSVVLSGVFLLTSCAPTEEPIQGFSDIDDLRLAFEEAGGSCSSWVQDNAVTGALQSGNCDSETVLMFFGSKEDASDRALDLKKTTKDFGFTPHLLLGENWLINSPQVDLVEPELGGVLIVD